MEEKKEEVVFPVWMYHKKFGAKLFETMTDSVSKELEKEGWKDSPARVDEPIAGNVPATAKGK